MTTTRLALDETGAGARISAVVGSWPDIEVGDHRFGGVEFRLGRRELGHLHGESHADIAFPRRARRDGPCTAPSSDPRLWVGLGSHRQ